MLGDWILCVSMGLNVAAGAAYAYQCHWRNVALVCGAAVELLADADAVRGIFL